MEPVKLSWSEAEVHDGELAVPVAGKMPKGWKQSFARTLALLGSGDWGEVTLKKDRILVGDVTPGSEEKLKHHLEAVIAQANTTIEEDEGLEGEDQPNDPDAEMTERFRSLG
jgi:hypothetical protein